jgi:hypothetical protein
MTETKPNRRWFRFSIRDLLWLTALIAMGLGWAVDHFQVLDLLEPPRVFPSSKMPDGTIRGVQWANGQKE